MNPKEMKEELETLLKAYNFYAEIVNDITSTEELKETALLALRQLVCDHPLLFLHLSSINQDGFRDLMISSIGEEKFERIKAWATFQVAFKMQRG